MTEFASASHGPPLHVDPPALPDVFSQALRVTTHIRQAGTVLVLVGELDIATADMLTCLLSGTAPDLGIHLVGDLSALTFCDCAGLTALLRVHRHAAEHGGWLRLCTATTTMDRLLRVTRLNAVLRTFPAVDDAFASPSVHR
ncbi:MAG TPA: STAS domain-containing protein [Actinocrinis sp.]|nr:STAS domain-containing protein [Actinocrinis sp.]